MAPALALSPDPDAALVRLERVAEAVGRPGRRTLADLLATDPAGGSPARHVAGASSFATDLLVADPTRIVALSDTLLGGRDRRRAGELVDAVARSAGRELSPRETGEALSAVAVRVVRDALAAAEPDLPFAVIGMGKLGARELNVASDLDLMFVYEGEGAGDLQRARSGRRAGAARHPRRRVGTRRRPAPGGPQRTARAFDRGLPRVLGALRRDVGVPGAAAGARDRRRRQTSAAGSS